MRRFRNFALDAIALTVLAALLWCGYEGCSCHSAPVPFPHRHRFEPAGKWLLHWTDSGITTTWAVFLDREGKYEAIGEQGQRWTGSWTYRSGWLAVTEAACGEQRAWMAWRVRLPPTTGRVQWLQREVIAKWERRR